MTDLQNTIEKAWEDRGLLKETATQNAIREVIELIDKGQLRIAHPKGSTWQVNEWVKKAVIMYFPIQRMKTMKQVR